MTFKHPQTTACDLAGLQQIQSAKPVLIVAEVQSESEISLGLLGDLLVVLFVFSLSAFGKEGKTPQLPFD